MSQNRQLAAIMFTDIVGYTAIMGKDEDKALSLLNENRKIQKPLIEKYNGRLLKELGDGMLVQFNSAYDAVRCAKDIQHQAGKEMDAQLRIGIHLGDVTSENDDVFGDGVNVASRIQGIADPGGIYVSESIVNAIRNRSDIERKYLGEAALKNVDYPVKIYAVQGDGLPETHFKPTKIKKRKRIAAAYIFLAILAIATWFVIRNLKPDEIQSVRSMVVLPFTNMTGSEKNEYVVDQLHDILITELSHIKSLRVIGKTTANKYANSDLSAKEIADELNVDAVVESSVLRADDSIRLNVQLLRMEPEEGHLWAEIIDQSLGQVLNMVGYVTQEISKSIAAVLSPEEEKLITFKEEVDPELMKLFLEGKYFIDQYTPDGFQKGLQILNEVTQKDPGFAKAYAALSIGYGDLAHLPSAPQDAFPRAKALAERALNLDPTLVEANTAMAEAHLYHTWQFNNAKQYFEAALAIDSSFAPAVSNYGWYLDLIGNKEKAEYYLRKAADLDPLAPIYRTWLAWWYWGEKRYDEGLTEINKVFEYAPEFPIAELVIGGIYADLGKFDEAIMHSGKAAETFPGQDWGLGMAYVKAGRLKEAHDLVDKMDKTPFNAWSLMIIYSELGEKDEAYKWAKMTYEIRHIFTPWVASGLFTNLREDAKVQELLRPITDSIASVQNSL